MRFNEILSIAALLVVVALVIGLVGPFEEGPTGFATKGGEYSIFDEVKSELKGPDEVISDYEEHEEIVGIIRTQAEKEGISDPYAFMGQMYVESDYFAETPIRCEDSYERYWEQVTSRCERGTSGCESHPWHQTYETCQKLDGECDKGIYCKAAGGGGKECSFTKEGESTEEYHRVSCSYGPGQVMYPTALGYGFRGTAKELVQDKQTNIELSVKHFMRGAQEFQDSPQPMVDAILAYNAGVGGVRDAKEAGDAFSDYVNELPNPSARSAYVAKSIAYGAMFEAVADGERVKEWDGALESAEEKFEAPSSYSVRKYSVSSRPTFSTTVNYSFTDYLHLKRKARQLLDSCTDPLTRDVCITRQLDSFTRMNWSYGSECLEDASHFRLLQWLDRCTKAYNPSCACPLSSSPEATLQNKPSGILVRTENRTTLLGGATQDQSPIELQGNRINGDADASLIVEENASLRVATQDTHHACSVPRKRTYRFCVRTPQKLSYIDQETSRFESRPVIYRFALTFSNEMSTPSEWEWDDGMLETTNELENDGTKLVTKMKGVDS